MIKEHNCTTCKYSTYRDYPELICKKTGRVVSCFNSCGGWADPQYLDPIR